MAQIEAFRAIRFSGSEISHLVAPPYDVLTQADKDALLAKDDHNIVAIDLPHVPPKTAGPDEVYQRAAGEMTSWMDIRCIARDPEPAIYVYRQMYRAGNKTLTRKMFFARLRLEPFGKGAVLPHEETFGGPKEDRLKLTEASRCNLSPIFGLYPDPANEISALLDSAIGKAPDQSAVLDGVQNSLYVVTDDEAITAVQEKMSNKPIFIADGHHRYSTSLMYREAQVQQTGEPFADDPANFVLTVFCSMEDPGATIQPYFRTIADPANLRSTDLEKAVTKECHFRVTPRPEDSEALASMLAAASPMAFALYFPQENVCAVMWPRDEELLKKFEPSRHPAWRKLAYSIFHRYLIDEVISKHFNSSKPPVIHYHKTMDDTIADAKDVLGVAALMPASTMQQLREICTAGELMPQKSTYFFPKLATGLVINPLY